MNQNYNTEITRAAFWLEMSEQLLGFERLVHKRESLSKMDKQILRRVHEMLYESYKLVDRQREYHNRQLKKMREEYLNER